MSSDNDIAKPVPQLQNLNMTIAQAEPLALAKVMLHDRARWKSAINTSRLLWLDYF
jgi:hypothetical protein